MPPTRLRWYIDNAEQLAGLPGRRAGGGATGGGGRCKIGWKFTLQMPSYLPLMQYYDNRELREQLYRALCHLRVGIPARRSPDNTPLIDKILALRSEEATLLGYLNYAAVSLATKMAESPAQVLQFPAISPPRPSRMRSATGRS